MASRVDNAAAGEPKSGLPSARPLVIDVDGTLVRVSPALEALVAYVKPNPLRALEVAAWLRHGPAHVRKLLAGTATTDLADLPVDEQVLSMARAAAESGRPVYLATAEDERRAGDLLRSFPFVAGVIASSATARLEGEARARALADRFPDGFDYVGSSGRDVPVWRRCRGAVLAGAPAWVRRRIGTRMGAVESWPARGTTVALVRSMRPQQWVKNVLVFTPLVLGGRLTDVGALAATVAAFLAMCLVASATYILNDALDLQHDRKHWSKRQRPLASGELALDQALSAAALGLLAGGVIAGLVAWTALAAVTAYVVLTLSYSLALKRLPIVDGLALATLYTLRLMLGVAAAAVPPSPWLFVFSMFIFTSLSLAKRHTELQRVIEKQGERMHGRGYRCEDLPLLLALGVAAGLSAVIVIIFYILDDAFRQSFYGSTVWLWGFPPLMFLFVARIWLVTVRGEMSDDPIEFAVRDRASQAMLLLLLVCFAFAWLG